MARHAGHKLEPLTSTGNNYFPDGSGYDPMSVAYIQVGNGEETLLLRRNRSSIEQLFNYEIVNGRLLQAEPSLEIQADAISKEMKLHFSWAPAAPLNEDQISFFIALFRESVCAVDPCSAGASEDSETDENVSYCELSSDVVDDLMGRCNRHFSRAELTALRRFIDGHPKVAT